MKKIITLFIASFTSHIASSQQITFQKIFYGFNTDYAYSVQQTFDGGYIVSGRAEKIGTGNSSAYLIKTNAYGDTLWTKTYGASNEDYGNFVEQTTDSGYIVGGHTYSGAGNRDVYLIKTDVNGDTLWTKSYGGTSGEWGGCVRQTNDGGYIISGFTQSFNLFSWHFYLVKTDANGNAIWSKAYDGAYPSAGSVQQTTDGGYCVIGSSLVLGDTSICLIKTNSNGDTLWSKKYGGINADEGAFGDQTSDGGYIITGYTKSLGAGGSDVYLIKIDSLGNLLWSKTYGGANNEIGYYVLQTTDGGYVVTGRSNSYGNGINDAVYLIKTNMNGDTLWTRTYNASFSQGGYSVQQATDGGYIVAGFINTNVYLIKTDSFGNSGCYEGTRGAIVTSPATIVTNFAPAVASPATIVSTPNLQINNGSNVNTLCATVGLNTLVLESEELSVFPNPASLEITVRRNRFEVKSNIKIYDVFGRTVLEKEFPVTNCKLNIANLNQGIYFIKVGGVVKKFMKE